MFSLAHAMGSQLQEANNHGGWVSALPALVATLMPFILLSVFFYFILIKPYFKKAKEHQQKLEAIKKEKKIP